jgi:hypothetical protein
MTSRKSPAFFAPIVDRATALALRRTTRGKKHGRSTPIPSLLSSPTIHNLPAHGASSLDAPVLFVPAVPRGEGLVVRPPSSLARLGVDLSWMIALVVALGVTLALAIPLELFRP